MAPSRTLPDLDSPSVAYVRTSLDSPPYSSEQPGIHFPQTTPTSACTPFDCIVPLHPFLPSVYVLSVPLTVPRPPNCSHCIRVDVSLRTDVVLSSVAGLFQSGWAGWPLLHRCRHQPEERGPLTFIERCTPLKAANATCRTKDPTVGGYRY
jgi:hypothetical protein